MNKKSVNIIMGTFTAWFFIGGICLSLYACPQYKIYEQRASGEAKLAEAMSSRKIAIQEAEAKKESAAMLADAEVVRAQGFLG